MNYCGQEWKVYISKLKLFYILAKIMQKLFFHDFENRVNE